MTGIMFRCSNVVIPQNAPVSTAYYLTSQMSNPKLGFFPADFQKCKSGQAFNAYAIQMDNNYHSDKTAMNGIKLYCDKL